MWIESLNGYEVDVFVLGFLSPNPQAIKLKKKEERKRGWNVFGIS